MKDGILLFTTTRLICNWRLQQLQRLTSFIIRHFWLPVDGGAKPDSEVRWILSFILGGREGEEVARRIDGTIAKLPDLVGLTVFLEAMTRPLPPQRKISVQVRAKGNLGDN